MLKNYPVGSGLVWCFVLLSLVLVGAVEALSHGVSAGDKGYNFQIARKAFEGGICRYDLVRVYVHIVKSLKRLRCYVST